eukprot:38371_1
MFVSSFKLKTFQQQKNVFPSGTTSQTEHHKFTNINLIQTKKMIQTITTAFAIYTVSSASRLLLQQPPMYLPITTKGATTIPPVVSVPVVVSLPPVVTLPPVVSLQPVVSLPPEVSLPPVV